MADRSKADDSSRCRAEPRSCRFLSGGAAVGVSAAALVASSPATATSAKEIVWDREVDVIVIGAGASGLPACIAARDQGASVMVVDHHFDTGGIAIMSGGDIRIGGGNRLQKAAGINEMPDDVFKLWTDPLKHRFADADSCVGSPMRTLRHSTFSKRTGSTSISTGPSVPKEVKPGVTDAGMRPADCVDPHGQARARSRPERLWYRATART